MIKRIVKGKILYKMSKFFEKMRSIKNAFWKKKLNFLLFFNEFFLFFIKKSREKIIFFNHGNENIGNRIKNIANF